MLTVREAQEEAERIRQQSGPVGDMLSPQDTIDIFSAAGLNGEEMMRMAKEIGTKFGLAAEFDQPPYKAVCAGMWSDGFIAGVIYGRAVQMANGDVG